MKVYTHAHHHQIVFESTKRKRDIEFDRGDILASLFGTLDPEIPEWCCGEMVGSDRPEELLSPAFSVSERQEFAEYMAQRWLAWAKEST